MLFVPARMRHIVFGLLALFKLITGTKPKTKEPPQPTEQKGTPGKTGPKLFKHNNPYETAPGKAIPRPKLSVIRVIMLNSRTADPLAFPWTHSAQEPAFRWLHITQNRKKKQSEDKRAPRKASAGKKSRPRQVPVRFLVGLILSGKNLTGSLDFSPRPLNRKLSFFPVFSFGVIII
jgi:hypothetical protein